LYTSFFKIDKRSFIAQSLFGFGFRFRGLHPSPLPVASKKAPTNRLSDPGLDDTGDLSLVKTGKHGRNLKLNPKEIHFETIGSTHKFAVENGDSLAHLAVITADNQTCGRGRLGRKWLSSIGTSALISIVTKPDITPDRASQITALMAVTAARVLTCLGIKTEIKWPNDILICDKKIAGILAEASLRGNSVGFIVASIGINLNQREEEVALIDRPATSVFMETGIRHDPAEIRRQFLSSFKELYEIFRLEGFHPILKEWKKSLAYLGDRVLLDLGGQVIDGKICDIDEDACIIIDAGDGQKRRFSSGEITSVRSKTERISDDSRRI